MDHHHHNASSPIQTEGGGVGGSASVRIQISRLKSKLSDGDGAEAASPTIFEPQNGSVGTKTSSAAANETPPTTRPSIRAPEKKLTLFALRLALLEKTASGLGTLGFIWATVVLLGGFAITLDTTDFWFITVILLIEGTRIFSRSRELEWQHQATWTITDVGINSFRAIKSSSSSVIKTIKSACRPILPSRTSGTQLQRRELPGEKNRKIWSEQKVPTRTWTSSEVPLLPYAKWVFLSKNVSRVLYWLQIASATACVVLSTIKLVHRDYGEVEKDHSEKRNRKAALIIFYSLALSEALLFLLEKAYWEYKVSFKRLLDSVNKDCELGDSGLVSIRRFFYDAYSRCINGSVFDGLKMDMVSFAMELLGSSSPDEQLIGARILRKFSLNPRFSEDTLQKIGISLSVMERLVEMLNWKDIEEEEIRYSAAEILSKLAAKRQNSLRIAGIPGAMESISSLLHISRSHNSCACDEISEKRIIVDAENYGSWSFNHLGLQILKKLARDHDICGKIGNTKGLLPKIIDFTLAEERLLKHPTATLSQIVTVKRSLQVLKMLASTAGTAGKQLRREITEIVFTISYIRDILRHGENQPELQILGIEILTSLAIEEDATERIGGTGGVLRVLFDIFFNYEIPENYRHVRSSAGEAITMLALESKNTCQRILKLRINENLIKALETPLLRVNAARILRNLCAYSGNDGFEKLKGLTAAAPIILDAIMKEESKLQEVMIGAGAYVFKFMNSQDSRIMYDRCGMVEFDLAHRVFMVLKRYRYPSIKVPSIRRYAIELAIWMMRDNKTNVRSFDSLGMAEELESVMETTSELENFNIFSGTVGLCRHKMTMDSLVEIAMKLLEEVKNWNGAEN